MSELAEEMHCLLRNNKQKSKKQKAKGTKCFAGYGCRAGFRTEVVSFVQQCRKRRRGSETGD
jgi:hypothetical protein